MDRIDRFLIFLMFAIIFTLNQINIYRLVKIEEKLLNFEQQIVYLESKVK